MKQFALTYWTSDFIESANPRPEKHGKEDVIAISLNLRLSDESNLLDLVSESLLEAMFERGDTEPLPGVPEVRTKLRSDDCDGLEIPLKRVPTLEGATVYFDYGADGEDEPITLTKSKVDKFRVVLHKGGTVDVLFRVGSNDISAHEIGDLCSKMRQWIRMRIEPAVEAQKPDVESNGAPLFEEPSEARLAAEAAFQPGAEGMDPNAGFDATDAFVASVD